MSYSETGTTNSQQPEAIKRPTTKAERDRLIIDFAPLVKRTAYRIASRLPDSIQVDDLISIGTVGLIDAVDKFNPEKGKGFRAYAELRIKGAILDELRGYDNLSRANRRRANELGQAVQELEHKLGRSPRDEEIAEILDIDMEELHGIRSATRSLVFLDIDELTYVTESEPDSNSSGHNASLDFEPFRALSAKTLKENLADCIDRLPEKLKLVLSLYYFSELNYKEIGAVLDLSESRISQLHTKAILKLRKMFKSQDTEI